MKTPIKLIYFFLCMFIFPSNAQSYECDPKLVNKYAKDAKAYKLRKLKSSGRVFCEGVVERKNSIRKPIVKIIGFHGDSYNFNTDRNKIKISFIGIEDEPVHSYLVSSVGAKDYRRYEVFEKYNKPIDIRLDIIKDLGFDKELDENSHSTILSGLACTPSCTDDDKRYVATQVITDMSQTNDNDQQSPLYLSVLLPEGNQNVSIMISDPGDLKEISYVVKDIFISKSSKRVIKYPIAAFEGEKRVDVFVKIIDGEDTEDSAILVGY